MRKFLKKTWTRIAGWAGRAWSKVSKKTKTLWRNAGAVLGVAWSAVKEAVQDHHKRMKTDPAYRRQVAQTLRALSARLGGKVGARLQALVTLYVSLYGPTLAKVA